MRWADRYKGAPWIQELYSPRWDGLFVPVRRLPATEQMRLFHDPNVTRIAVIRDPLERLLSAWRSKIKCETTRAHGTDVWERSRMVDGLLRLLPERGSRLVSHLSGLKNITLNLSGRTCLYLHEFADVLASIHAAGKAGFLGNFKF